MKNSNVFDPKNVDILDAEDRKTWQNPEEILEAITLDHDYVAADLGCGSGFFTIPLSRRVKKVYGIDIQKDMLEYLKQKIKREKIDNIELLLSGGDEIPLKNESVDLMMSANTLHEFDNKKKIIREIRRVLKDQGKVVVVDFKKKDIGFGPPVAIRVSRNQAKHLFEESGFISLKSKELTYHYLIVFLNSQ